MNKRVSWYFLVATMTWIIADISAIFGLKISSSFNFSILSRLQLFITYIGAVLFLKEIVHLKKIAALLLAFIGSILSVYHFQTSLAISFGDLLFIVYAILISISGLVRQKITGNLPVPQITYYMFGLSAIIMGLLVLIFQPVYHILYPGYIFINSILGLSGFTLVNYAIANGGAAQFSLITSLLPFMTAIFSFLLLKQIPTSNQFLGGGLIIISIYLFISTRFKKIIQ